MLIQNDPSRRLALGHNLLSLLTLVLFGLAFAAAHAQESPPGPTRENSLTGYEFTFPAMGTQVELKAYHHDAGLVEQAFEQVRAQVAQLEAILTDYDPQSETRQLTTRARNEPTPVSQPLWAVLVAANRWHDLSDGAFDASLGQLTQLWRKYRRAKRLPPPETIQAARDQTGWHAVTLDPAAHTVQFSQDELQLDFGGIGKGFVVDRAFELLQSQGLSRLLVNISGNMRAGWPPPDRAGWRIEIAPLEQGAPPLRRLHLANAAIATSGDLWQFVIMDGVRRSHILDPRTGLGVPGPLCATVLSPTATDADALATIACIIGFEPAARIAQQLGQTELLVAQRTPAPSPAQASNADLRNSTALNDIRIEATAGFPEEVSSQQ